MGRFLCPHFGVWIPFQRFSCTFLRLIFDFLTTKCAFYFNVQESAMHPAVQIWPVFKNSPSKNQVREGVLKSKQAISGSHFPTLIEFQSKRL